MGGRKNLKQIKNLPQQGFALLTVLMIVALIAMMGSQLMYEQYTNIKRSSHMMHQAQSFAVQWGVESWIKKGLKLDLENNDYDALDDAWQTPFGPVPYEGGNISARLVDLNSRLNLNNVIEQDEKKRLLWLAVTKRYALQNGLNSRFSDVVKDWIDADDIPSAFGAEGNVYLLLKPAYNAANQPMVMLNELKMMDGLQRIEYDVWQMLEKDLTTLPTVTKINVNTADVRVLVALADWLDEAVASAWVTQRLSEPARKIDDFIDFLVTAKGMPRTEIKKGLPDWMVSVQSDYFLLKTQVDYGESQQGLSAIFSRHPDNQNEVRLVQRWLNAE
ncbi:MAG: type II secretion system minor pseudopilin GspK [Thiomicrorhabdus sp.]|nr:type II secretion system minor pseudopilin GspK [Thiomicrorhabdus sp.]